MGRGKNILLVDDTEMLRVLLQEELEEAGYSVRIAATGREAWEILQQEAAGIGLVITDGSHPAPDGLELLRLIKARWPDLPVILHSAYSSYNFEREKCWPDEYIVKDSDLARLKTAIKRQLGEE